MKQILFILLAAIPFCFLNSAVAQDIRLSDDARISLVTILPGETPEELFGHSAVRVHDPQSNIDLSFNYGTFQFDDLFLLKFIYGDLVYFLSVSPFPSTVEYYRERRRPMFEQTLNLSPPQKQKLFEFLTENAREENRYYHYDFLFDNCSTRIRDALESSLGEDVEFTTGTASNLTFRELIHLYVDHRSFIHFGIDLLLGKKIDHIATSREEMFLPDYLMKGFNNATVKINGEIQPLVDNTSQVLQIKYYETEPGYPWAVLLSWGLLLGGIVITIRNFKTGQGITTWFDIPLFTLIGLIGLLILFLWFFSLHDVTDYNLNLLWAWPVHVFLAPLLYKRVAQVGIVSGYLIISALCCIIILAGWYVWPQNLHAAVIPLLLLLSIRSGTIAFHARIRSKTQPETDLIF